MLQSITTRRPRFLIFTVLGLSIWSCRGETEAPPSNPRNETSTNLVREALVERPKSAAMRFEKRSAANTGIDFTAPLEENHPRRYLYHSGFFCGGVAVGDLNGDDLPDLFFVSGPERNRLYLNHGGFRFEEPEASRDTIGGGDAWGTGVAMVDIDNDADLDLFICNYDSPNRLYLNDGRAQFEEVSAEWHLDLVDASLWPAFCDYDRDGDLDLYLLTYRYYHPQGAPQPLPVRMTSDGPQIDAAYEKYFGVIDLGDGRPRVRPVGRADYLFRNDGRQGFTNVTAEAGISGKGFGLSATWWDHDLDGWPDLYVANDLKDGDHFYHNNGDGTFTDIIAESMPHTTWFSMGADSGDLNNDGLPDLLVADMSATTHFMQKTTMGAMGASQAEMERMRPHQYMRNGLFVNSGTDRFLEAAYLAGLADTDWTWAVKLADVDNDGWVDAFFTNGMTRSFNDSDQAASPRDLLTMTEWDAYAHTSRRLEQNLAFRNRGDLRFEDVSQSWEWDHTGISGPCAWGDLDRDGDLDCVVVNIEEPVSIYENLENQHHRVLFRLVGTESNRHGWGARVTVDTGTQQLQRFLMPGNGFLSYDEPLVHFGLASADRIERATIDWPSGHRQVLTDLPANQIYTVVESPSEATQENQELLASANPWFRESDKLPKILHVEQPYDDFAREPLLPNRMSQLGPGIACADVDLDGDIDFFLGGAAGQPGGLWLNDGHGKFQVSSTSPWAPDRGAEDMGVLFFEADGDGDPDLYVVSGSVECEPGAEILQDRLYLNDGHGNFVRAEDALPEMRDSGSGVSAADFDGDGDLDLFVGGRVVPGQYPLPARSHLLRNENGAFVDVTEEMVPGLADSGLVTSGLWSDVNGDARPDLLVTHEWGPVKLFINHDGRLEEQTEEAGLASFTGWWNSIAGRDLDADGDLDFVVGNFGLNTKYHASQEHPALIYHGDFDGGGKRQIIEAEFEADILYPIRGRSCSSRAMPFLADKFPTYRSFAVAPLESLYTEHRLQDADRFAATTLESGCLINDGEGHFEFRPLPRLVQIAPSFGVGLTELDGDGWPDLLVAQNFFSPQWETGRMAGGLSLALRGGASGKFTVVETRDSGIRLAGDPKGLALADMNQDGWPDVLIGQNDNRLLLWERQVPHEAENLLRLRLQGPPANPTAIGAKVRVYISGMPTQCAEVSAGGGYLSQSTADLFFGQGTEAGTIRLEITWPDGERTEHTANAPVTTPLVIAADAAHSASASGS